MSDVLKKLITGQKYVFHPSGMEQPYQLQGKTAVYLFIGFNLEGHPVFDVGNGAFTKSKDDTHFLANLRDYREPREITVWGVVYESDGKARMSMGYYQSEKEARNIWSTVKELIDVFPITWKEKV